MRSIAMALVISLVTVGAAFAQSESQAWRQVAEAIPLGSGVTVQLLDGKRLSGTLMRVDGSAVLVKRNTRRPEPAVNVPFDEVSKLERDTSKGSNVAKAIAIGVGAGAATVLTMIMFAIHVSD